MWKKLMTLTAAAALTLGFTACSSFETATRLHDQKLSTQENLESVAHVHAEIWGVYLFNLPIFAGSSLNAGKGTMFQDNATVNNTVSLAANCVRNKLNGKYLTDVTSETTSVWLMPTVLFWYKSVQVSGNVLK